MPPALRHTAGCPSGQRERSVKPSAQPTLVRTQHLPPPAKTARWLRKRGPAGRFLLVTPCIRVCHRGSMRSSGYGHIADSVRAKRAVRITARFADPRPFCPVSGRGLLADGMPRIPVGRFFAVLLAPGGGLALFVPAAGAAGLPDRPAPSHRGSTEGDRVCVAATGMEDPHGAVASGAVSGAGRRGEPRRHAPRVGLGAVTVDDLQLGGQDEVTGDLAVPAGAAAAGGAAGWRWGLWSASASRRLIILLGHYRRSTVLTTSYPV